MSVSGGVNSGPAQMTQWGMQPVAGAVQSGGNWYAPGSYMSGNTGQMVGNIIGKVGSSSTGVTSPAPSGALPGSTTLPQPPASSSVPSNLTPTAATTSSFPSGPAGPFSTLQPQLQQTATQAMTGGQAVYNMGMDPQQALYDRTLQQLQDQTRVGEAARGVTMSPYGAGVENQNLQDFRVNRIISCR